MIESEFVFQFVEIVQDGDASALIQFTWFANPDVSVPMRGEEKISIGFVVQIECLGDELIERKKERRTLEESGADLLMAFQRKIQL